MKEYEVWARKDGKWVLCDTFTYLTDASKAALNLWMDEELNLVQTQVRMFSGRILKEFG